MKSCPLPQYDATGEFTTAVECLGGAGFFPVHSGLLAEGLSRPSPPRVVIFGTDWGSIERCCECDRTMKTGRSCRCQLSLRPGSNGKRPYPTERNLYDVLTDACQESRAGGGCLDLASIFLTNAVLGLVPADMEGNDQVYRGHPQYLRACGAYHRQWLYDHQPRHVVLMGLPHLVNYGISLWSEVWPKLFGLGGVWYGVKSLKEAFSGQTVTRDPDSGLRVQLMYHPSRKHLQPETAWRRTVEDLAAAE